MTKPRLQVGVATSIPRVFLSHRVFRLACTMPQFLGRVDFLCAPKAKSIQGTLRKLFHERILKYGFCMRSLQK